MQEFNNYFNENKNTILSFIESEQYIFPKKFIENINDLYDENFYEKIKQRDTIFSYFFSFNQIVIFSIQRFMMNEFYFQSNYNYETIYLFFSEKHEIYINNKKVNDQFLVCKSNEEVIINNGDFLKICFFKNKKFKFEDLLITSEEKNLFEKNKIKKIITKYSNVSLIKKLI